MLRALYQLSCVCLCSPVLHPWHARFYVQADDDLASAASKGTTTKPIYKKKKKPKRKSKSKWEDDEAPVVSEPKSVADGEDALDSWEAALTDVRASAGLHPGLSRRVYTPYASASAVGL
jgi:hypothetical protein